MLRSLRTAERAMQLQQLRLETLANNLANVDSSGFKQILTQVTHEDRARQQVDRINDLQLRDPEKSVVDAVWQPLPATRIKAVADHRQGALHTTGRDLDLAIVGDGFFEVGEGDNRQYTRNGSFHLDRNRQLVTADGLKLQSTSGPVTIEGTSIGVAEDGTVTVDGLEVGQIKVIKFSDPRGLDHVAGSRFRPPPDQTFEEVSSNEVRIAQGQLEHSNVNAIDTLIDMIAAQRAFEIEAKILQANDETLDRSVNQLGRKA